MTHRQNQQIALQPTTGIGGDSALVKIQRLFTQVNQSPAARPYRLGKTLADVAPELAALGVQRAVFTPRLRIVSKSRLTTVPAVKSALFLTGQLHPRGGHVDSVAGFSGGIGDARPGNGTLLQQRYP